MNMIHEVMQDDRSRKLLALTIGGICLSAFGLGVREVCQWEATIARSRTRGQVNAAPVCIPLTLRSVTAVGLGLAAGSLAKLLTGSDLIVAIAATIALRAGFGLGGPRAMASLGLSAIASILVLGVLLLSGHSKH